MAPAARAQVFGLTAVDVEVPDSAAGLVSTAPATTALPDIPAASSGTYLTEPPPAVFASPVAAAAAAAATTPGLPASAPADTRAPPMSMSAPATLGRAAKSLSPKPPSASAAASPPSPLTAPLSSMLTPVGPHSPASTVSSRALATAAAATANATAASATTSGSTSARQRLPPIGSSGTAAGATSSSSSMVPEQERAAQAPTTPGSRLVTPAAGMGTFSADPRNFDGRDLHELVKVSWQDYSDVERVQHIIEVGLSHNTAEASIAEALLQIREASLHNPLFVVTPTMMKLLREQLMSRNRLLRPAAAYALAGYGANSRFGRGLVSAGSELLLPRLNNMLRCKVDSLDARYASLAIQSATLHAEHKEAVGRSGSIPLLISLVRQNVNRSGPAPPAHGEGIQHLINLTELPPTDRPSNASVLSSSLSIRPETTDEPIAAADGGNGTAFASSAASAAAAAAAGLPLAGVGRSGGAAAFSHGPHVHHGLAFSQSYAGPDSSSGGIGSAAAPALPPHSFSTPLPGLHNFHTHSAAGAGSAAGDAGTSLHDHITPPPRGGLPQFQLVQHQQHLLHQSHLHPSAAAAAVPPPQRTSALLADMLMAGTSDEELPTSPTKGTYLLHVKPAAAHAMAALVNLAELPANRQRMRDAGIWTVLEDVLGSRNENLLKERCRLLIDLFSMDTERYKEDKAAAEVSTVASVGQAVVAFIHRGRDAKAQAAAAAAGCGPPIPNSVGGGTGTGSGSGSGGLDGLHHHPRIGPSASHFGTLMGSISLRGTLAYNLARQLERGDEEGDRKAGSVTIQQRVARSVTRAPSRAVSRAQSRRVSHAAGALSGSPNVSGAAPAASVTAGKAAAGETPLAMSSGPSMASAHSSSSAAAQRRISSSSSGGSGGLPP